MDLRRHFDVLWRFRPVVGGAFVVGVLLALLATFRVTFADGPGLDWRHRPIYKSDSVLFVTQPGFPWGRANLPVADGPPSTPQGQSLTRQSAAQNFADPSRFSGLASIYSFLVRSDSVRRRIPGHPSDDEIAAQPFTSQGGSGTETLPVIGLSTFADSPTAARRLNAQTISALIGYLNAQQDATRTPQEARAKITMLNPPGPGTVAQGRSKTKAVVVFLLAVIGGIALAYLLENLRPSALRTSAPPLGGAALDPSGVALLGEEGHGRARPPAADVQPLPSDRRAPGS